MKNEKELFNSLLVSTGKNIPWSKKDEQKEAIFYRFLAGVLLFAGAEAVMVVFRKNFQRESLNILALIVACLAFIGISILSFVEADDKHALTLTEPNVDVVRGCVYLLIAILVICSGAIKGHKSSDNNPYYKGESQLLGFLTKDGLKQNIIQYVFEPLVVLGIAGFYCFFDLAGGLPLMACGLSIWVRWVIEKFFLENPIQSTINMQQASQNQNGKRITNRAS